MTRAVLPKYVLDASVAAKWFTRHEEPHRERAVALRELHQSRRCILAIPELALLEVLNAIRYGPRAEERDARHAIALLEKLRLEVVPLDGELLRAAITVAWGYRITLYDATYVAVAERLGAPLVTADEAMALKLSGHPSVARLADVDLI